MEMDYKKLFLKKIKNYYLLKELSKNLFLSYDEKLNKICTIKVIPKTIEINKKIQLKNDIDKFIKIHNQNLINLISYEATSNNIYLILEYCNGGNLKKLLEFLKNNNDFLFKLKLIQNIISQIINGLEFLHMNKKIFGFLSMENIFINFNKYENILNNEKIQEKIIFSKELLEESFTLKLKLIDIINFTH